MTRLRSFSKSLVCVVLAAGLTPSPADAKPLPEDDFIPHELNSPRTVRVVVVASNQETVLQVIDCVYRQNVGACLDSGLAASGSSLSAFDTNRTGKFIQGPARVGSTLGPRATGYVNYSYDDLFIEGEIRIQAQE